MIKKIEIYYRKSLIKFQYYRNASVYWHFADFHKQSILKKISEASVYGHFADFYKKSHFSTRSDASVYGYFPDFQKIIVFLPF